MAKRAGKTPSAAAGPDLFAPTAEESEKQPLARRLRPRSVEEFAGQAHLVAPGKPIREMIETGEVASMLLFGPPGTGKTALASLLARAAHAEVRVLNATTATTDDLREVFEYARFRRREGKRVLLFLDEVHRFDKRQQSGLLPELEEGNLFFIGATTENPSAYLLPALGSRVLLYELFPLTNEDLARLLARALADKEVGIGTGRYALEADAEKAILAHADGDARRALGLLEAAARRLPEASRIDAGRVAEVMGRKALRGDKSGDSHYDVASAFIKSMRGGDPDAAVYWLARYIETGEDPRFIARRMTILASEDIGNADPRALFLATAAFQAVSFVGMPESRIILSQVASYLAGAPKSNASYLAISAAQADVREKPVLEVPMHLRGSGYRDAERLGRGEGYEYPHDAPGHFLPQAYLPEKRSYYKPTTEGEEKRLLERLVKWWGTWPR